MKVCKNRASHSQLDFSDMMSYWVAHPGYDDEDWFSLDSLQQKQLDRHVEAEHPLSHICHTLSRIRDIPWRHSGSFTKPNFKCNHRNARMELWLRRSRILRDAIYFHADCQPIQEDSKRHLSISSVDHKIHT
eukprot:s819_g14.t1